MYTGWVLTMSCYHRCVLTVNLCACVCLSVSCRNSKQLSKWSGALLLLCTNHCMLCAEGVLMCLSVCSYVLCFNRKQLSKWQRTRKFVCLVVEEVEGDDMPSSSSSSSSGGMHAGGAPSSSSSSSSSSSYGGGSSMSSLDECEPSSSGRVVATATLSVMQVRGCVRAGCGWVVVRWRQQDSVSCRWVAWAG
jgi:hypothetical protein